MKKSQLKILLLFVFSMLSTFSYSQKILWEKSYGGKHADYLMDAKPTPDYGFILAGSSLSKKSGNKTEDNNGDLDYWIWKMNEEGELDWQKNFGGTGSDFLQSIALTNDAGYILAGISNSNKGFNKEADSKGQDDFWIIKLTATGSVEWQKTIGGSAQEKLSTIVQTKDGGYIIGGSSSSEPEEKQKSITNPNEATHKTSEYFGNLDYWVVKLDRKGKIEWQKTYGGIYADELRSIEQTFEGGFIIGGYSNSPKSGNKADDNKGIGDYWILKTDAKGEIIWQKTIGGDKDDQLYVAHQTYDKGYILGGNSNSNASEEKSSTNSEGTDFWVLKLDENGSIKWQETFNFGKYDILTSLVENDDHTYLIGGFAKGELNSDAKLKLKNAKAKSGTDDYIALKIDEKGQELWSKTVGSNGEDVLKRVIETRDGGYLFAGTSNPQMTPSVIYGNSSASKSSSMLNGMTGENQQFNKAKSEVNSTISQTTDSINKELNNTTTKATNQVKDAIGLKEDSPLKLGSGELGNVLNAPSLGDGNTTNSKGASVPQKKLPPSGDKKNSFGNKDFWVVKVKDETKKEKPKLTIEAAPNPTLGYTNIVIGYDFESGTATVVDLSGRVIQKIEITSRTVPIDLTAQPEGIYIVNIKTNVQGDGVKIIKGISKN
jgi:hypothetical protein